MAYEAIKTQKNTNEPIKTQGNSIKITRRTTEQKHKTSNFYRLKWIETSKTCFRICFGVKMDEEDENKQETYVVGALGDVHAT